MSAESPVLRPDHVNYKPYAIRTGRYRMRKTPLSNISSASLKLLAATTQDGEWRIPAHMPINLSKHRIEYNEEYTAPSGGKCVWTFEDTAGAIASIRLANAAGMALVDLPFANDYVNTVSKLDMSLEELNTADVTSGLRKELGGASAPANYFPPTTAVPAANNYGIAAATLKTPLTKPDIQYALPGTLDTAVKRHRSIPLSIFKGTILAEDKDVVFGEEMYLRVSFEKSSKLGYEGTSISDPSVNPTALSGDLNLTGIYLYIAQQVDPETELYVKERFASGNMRFLYPHVQSWRTPTQGSGDQSVTLTFAPAYGKFLKRIVHTVFNSAATANLAYDHENMDGSKISSYQTTMDTKTLQDGRLSCKQLVNDDFRENQHLLKGSALQNSAAYYYNWLHVDAFSDARSLPVPDENVMDGLPMTEARLWTFEGTAVIANLIHYTWASFVREVVLRPAASGAPLEINVA